MKRTRTPKPSDFNTILSPYMEAALAPVPKLDFTKPIEREPTPPVHLPEWLNIFIATHGFDNVKSSLGKAYDLRLTEALYKSTLDMPFSEFTKLVNDVRSK